MQKHLYSGTGREGVATTSRQNQYAYGYFYGYSIKKYRHWTSGHKKQLLLSQFFLTIRKGLDRDFEHIIKAGVSRQCWTEIIPTTHQLDVDLYNDWLLVILLVGYTANPFGAYCHALP